MQQFVLRKFKYQWLKRNGKGVLRKNIEKVTGYSHSQVAWLVGQYQEFGRIRVMEYHRHRFPQKYTASEVALLAKTDELHSWLSRPATKRILEREFEVYGHDQIRHVVLISPLHTHGTRL